MQQIANPLGDSGLTVVRKSSHEARMTGGDWPVGAETMVGALRLDNVQWCVEDALERDVPGDFIETGVWRGGTTILMRAVLEAQGVRDRSVWVADSFRGVPPPDPARYPADRGLDLSVFDVLAVSKEEVAANFERYGLLDDQVRFVEGWFSDTLPTLGGQTWAVVRLDGDIYESTMDGLTNLYPNLSPGGYLIVDDYGAIRACRAAVEDFRNAQGIDEQIEQIDYTGVFWRKRD